MADYTISEEYGLTVVRGSVPVTLLEEFFPEDGRSVKEVAMDLQAALDATLVIGTPDAIEKARKELGVSHEPPQEIRYLPPSQQLAAWRHRGNVGTSSRALSCVLAGEPLPDDAPIDPPYDAADFERCVLLLRWVPALREHLSAAQWISPAWGLVIDAWGELEELLEQGDHGRLLINQRLAECRRLASPG